ncbi:MAG: ATP-binding protein [Longimicrobiales bacterium]
MPFQAVEANFGYLTLKPEQSNAFFRLMDQRYNRASTILTTNLGYEAWYEHFDKKPLVDALLDRLQHHWITSRINGPSLRTPPPEPPPATAEKHSPTRNSEKKKRSS